ncbi:2-nitropropane dioxygenase [Zychaea mexicana]|uniref:2-nitropropane dioxygenase n=1 Tax=Zychaea mexicana TaxID=64656 RepID=UPI0022FF0DCA|nr:2-nitropropane dioxygenase [Zychaea mexicana]KAI9499508.1 2-nitropropane dioxygenase [Zychaea mexicana]
MNSTLATAFTRAINIKYPVVQAPCAGHTSADLVAAVSNAGALGSLGAAMMPVDAMRSTIRAIKEKTTQPFSVNLFCRAAHTPTADELHQEYPNADAVLDQIRNDLKIPTPTKYLLRSPPLDEQISVILEEKVPVVSFTFGVLPDNELQRLWSAGVYLIGTATSVKEAMVLAGLDEADPTRKADAIVAQGLEAGGHRGTFLFDEQQLSTRELTKGVYEAFQRQQSSTKISVPILAAGGLSSGADVAELLYKFHADGAVLGSLFMLSKESSTPPVHRQIMIESDAQTRLTRGLSGRYARGYPNAFMDKMDKLSDADIPSYDIHSARTKDIVGYAAPKGMSDYMMLWSGTNARSAGQYTDQGTLPAATLVAKLAEDIFKEQQQ